YEYKCKDCGHEFEMIQKFSDRPVKKCPECAGKVEKLISQSSFVLKGTGWYQTDFAGKKTDKKEKPETPTPQCSSCPSAGRQ
ncbi:MAG: FmdB family zinc ribbon protein, partial [Thermodesulfobacteriota bacterium]